MLIHRSLTDIKRRENINIDRENQGKKKEILLLKFYVYTIKHQYLQMFGFKKTIMSNFHPHEVFHPQFQVDK